MHASLEERLIRLERANRILITLLVVGLVALGSLALAQQPTAEEVRAQKFVLVDPDTNQELAVLGRDATGTFLRLTNQGGALTASVGSDRPRLVGEDRNGNQEDLFDPKPKVRRLR